MLGLDLLYDTVSVKTISSKDTTLITNAKSYFEILPIFNTGAVFIGKARGGTYQAAALFRFMDIPDYKSTLTLDSIVSVSLKFYSGSYAFGDTTSSGNKLEFEIHRIDSLWTNLVRWDSMFTASGSINPDPSYPYINPAVIGRYSGTLPVTKVDSVTFKVDTLEIQLDKQLAIDWFKWQSDTSIKIRSLNMGLALVPTNNSNIIRQFSSQAVTSSNIHPLVKVVYIDSLGALDSIIMH